MSRDTSTRSSEDREDTSLSPGSFLWVIDLFSQLSLALFFVALGFAAWWFHSEWVAIPIFCQAMVQFQSLIGLVRERVEGDSV